MTHPQFLRPTDGPTVLVSLHKRKHATAFSLPCVLLCYDYVNVNYMICDLVHIFEGEKIPSEIKPPLTYMS